MAPCSTSKEHFSCYLLPFSTMRFDELPTELIVMLAKHCDPFTKDELRLSNRRMKNIFDTNVTWKPCLEELSLERVRSGPFAIDLIRVKSCTLYGKEEECSHNVKQGTLTTHAEAAALLADSLSKLSAVRCLTFSGMQIDELLLRVLLMESAKLNYSWHLVLEECSLQPPYTMFQIFANFSLKSIRIIRCRHAHNIINDQFIHSVSEEFVIDEMPPAKKILPSDYNISIVDQAIEELRGKLLQMKDDHGSPRFRVNLWRNHQWIELRHQLRSFERLKWIAVWLRNEDGKPEINYIKLLLSRALSAGPPDSYNQKEFEKRVESITKDLLHRLERSPIPRLELRNVAPNSNITIAAICDLIKVVVHKDNELYWNFGIIRIAKIEELKVLSGISNIECNPNPLWLNGLVNDNEQYQHFEIRTTDGRKTFIFTTNVN